ncbi:MAG: Gfo/Idh/MocA family oxidoreductase [Candidatus Cloacimonetes bacterium]|nr:Gfo/Idh/MocA family oxidoreductase [Candidatus Cloacimonadota bacterium]
MSILRMGLIGCGRISGKHFEAAEQLENAGFVTCADIIPERAAAAAEKYNLSSYYTDYHEMLAKEKIDLGVICAPSGLHPEIGIAVATKKIHVLTEKPMAINLKSADELIETCEANKVHLYVVKQNRLNPTMLLLKNAILKNRFGKIYLVQSNVFWQRPQTYYDMADWRGTWQYDGGAFLNQASHYVDALYWLIGPVNSVMAESATMARKIEAEDTGVALLKFSNGVIGSINVTMLTYPKNYEGSITVIGEKGTVKVGGIALNKIDKWEFEDYDDDDRLLEEANYQPLTVYGSGHLPYYLNVIESLKGKTNPYTNGRDGRSSLEIILAFYESVKSGKKINLPLKV